jgi:hypothetical protein
MKEWFNTLYFIPEVLSVILGKLYELYFINLKNKEEISLKLEMI